MTSDRVNRFLLKNALGPGTADTEIQTAHTGANMWPVAGDWSGCGRSIVGVFDQTARTFFLLESNSTGAHETVVEFGWADGLLPIAGVWPP